MRKFKIFNLLAAISIGVSAFAQQDIAPGNSSQRTAIPIQSKTSNNNKAVLPSEFIYSTADSLAAYGTPTTTGGSAGVIFFNNEFWVSKWSTDTLYTLNRNGSVTSIFTITGVSGTRSLTTDGTSIFIGNATDNIYAIDPVTKTLDSVITTTTPSVGSRVCAYDPTADNGNGGFWIANFTSDIELVSRTGVILTTIPQATHGVVSMYGGFVDTSTVNGGPHLALYSQGNSRDAYVEFVNIATGLSTGITYDTHFDLLDTQDPATVDDPIAGGLFLSDQYSPGQLTMIGLLQGGPDILFGYDYESPTCVNPAAPVATTQPNGDITITWTSNASNSNLVYGAPGFTNGTGTKISNVTSPYTLSNLPLNSVYEFRVEDSCSASNSSYWSFASNSVATPSAVPFFEDFETFGTNTSGNITANGWTNTNPPAPEWESGTGTSSSFTGPVEDHTIGAGGTFLYLECTGGSQGDFDELISPSIIIGANQRVLELGFWYHRYGVNMGDLEVYIDSNGVSNLLTTLTGEQQTAETDPWLEAVVPVVGYEGQTVQLRFKGIRGAGYESDMSIDDVSLIVPPSLDATVTGFISPELPLCPGTVNTVVGVSNFGTDTLNSVKVVYEVNGTRDSLTYTSQILPGDTVAVSLGSFTFVSGTSYDIMVYTKEPNGGADQRTINDTISFNGIQPGLSGNFTIDPSMAASGTNYIDFSSFAADAANFGICGPVLVNVAPGVYNEAVELISLPTSAANTITFDGSDSSLVTITHDGSIPDGTVLIDNSDYITFRNIGIETTGTTDAWAVHIFDSDHNTFTNCYIKASTTATSTTASAVILSGSNTSSTTAGTNNFNTISENKIVGGYYGIRVTAASSDYNVGNVFRDNDIDSVNLTGIYSSYQDSLTVLANTVDVTDRANSGADGIYSLYCFNSIFRKNNVNAVDYGFYLSNTTLSPVPLTRKTSIVNNMITSENDYGMYLFTVDSVDIFHNSVSVQGSSPAMYINKSASYADIDDYDFRNNILSSATSEALEILNTVDSIFIKMDYNVYYTGGTDLIKIGTTVYNDLASYQTASPTLNNFSLEGDPEFLSPTDLHIVGTFVNDAGDGTLNINEDIDGDVRPAPMAASVDPGADEYNPPLCPPPSNQSVANVTADSATIFWDGTASSYQYEIVLNGAAQGTGTRATTPMDSLRIGGLSPTTSYDYYVRAICGRSDTSIWLGPVTFTTPCSGFNIPYAENFDNVTTPDSPDCWSEIAPAVNTIQSVTSTDHSVAIPSLPNAMEINDATPDFFISPYFNNLPNANFRLNVKVAYEGGGQGFEDTLKIGVMSDPTDITTFRTISFLSGSAPAQFTNVEVDLNDANIIGNSHYIAFQHIAAGGGYEFYIDDFEVTEIVPLNAGVVELFSPQLPICPGTFAPVVGVQNLGSDTISTVDVVASVNGVLDTVTYTTQILPGDTAQVTLSNITFNTSTVYDLDFYTINPNNGNDTLNLDDTLSFVGLQTGLIGNYTIDSNNVTAGSNFQSFTDMASQFSAFGICGPITVDVVSGSGPYNEQVIFSEIQGTSATNSITINGNGETLAFASSTSANRAVITFEDVSFITVDSLIINADGGTYGWGTHMTGTAHDITINNSVIITDMTSTSTTNFAPVVITGSATALTTQSDVENVTVSNSTLSGGYYGITARGRSGNNRKGYTFVNNIIQDGRAYGIYVQYSDSALVENNDISRPNRTNSATFYGIYMVTSNLNARVNANIIHNTYDAFTSTSTTYGIAVSGDINPGEENYITNNLIHNINSNGTIYGIYDLGSDGAYYYNNTISLDDASATGGTTKGFYQSSASSNSAFINNIITIGRGGSGTKHGIDLNSSTTSINVDYNDVFINSTGSGAVYYGALGTSDELTLADWQANTPYGANSYDVDPKYVDASNDDYTPTQSLINAVALSVPQVTTDLYGVARAANPDLGAIEFDPPLVDNVGLNALISPVESNDSCYGSAQDVIVELINSGGTAIDFTNSVTDITMNVTGATTQTLTTTVNDNSRNGGSPLAIGSTILVNIGTINMSTAGTFNFDGYIDTFNDSLRGNDTLSMTITTSPISGGTISGNDSICSGDSTTLTTNNAVGSLQWQVLSGGSWVDIQGADSSMINVKPTVNTDYRVLACGTTPSDTVTVVPVSLTMPTIVKNDAVIVTCGSMGTDTLIASGDPGSTLEWFDAPVGGNSVTQGDTLFYTVNTSAPSSSVTDTFYVEAQSGSGIQKVGPADNTFGTGANFANVSAQELYFTANQALTIKSVFVYPNNAGVVDIELRDANGVVLQNKVVSVTNTAGERVDVDFVVAPGNYELGANDANTTTGGLYRNNTGASYPYTTANGSMTITGNSFGAAYYYFFYDIEVATGCTSGRTMVIGNVDCLVGIEDELANETSLSIYPNPSNGIFNLKINTEKKETFTLQVKDINGKSVYNETVSVNNKLTKAMDFSSFSKGVYFIHIQNGDAVKVEKLIIQ